MSFLDESVVRGIKASIESNTSQLGKIYKAKRLDFQTLSVDHSLVDGYLKDGWELNGEPLKTKTKIKKNKTHAKAFEDRIWCQFYELGFREMSFDENFVLPFSKDDKDTKQIDVIAIKDETIFLVECKSSAKPKKAPSYKDEFDLLSLRIDGFRKSLQQIYGKHVKIKYIFATHNLRLGLESDDMKRLMKAKAFYYNNNTYDYRGFNSQVQLP